MYCFPQSIAYKSWLFSWLEVNPSTKYDTRSNLERPDMHTQFHTSNVVFAFYNIRGRTPTLPPLLAANPTSVVITIVSLALLYHFFSTSISRKKLPPGPRGLPVVGNIFQLSNDVWFKFTEWKQTYGTQV